MYKCVLPTYLCAPASGNQGESQYQQRGGHEHIWGPGQNHSASNCSYAQTNFSFFLSLPENPILNYLLPEHQKKVVDRLSTSLPLTVTANIVSHEEYWKRCSVERWQACDVSNYGDSWKRMFFERHLENILKFSIPNITDPKQVLELIPLCKSYVRKLEINQFLPPLWVGQKEEGNDLSDTEDDAEIGEVYTHHYNLKDVITALPHLEELNLIYGVKSCGMNFEWSLFNFTELDCSNLAAAVKMCRNLKVIYRKLNLTASARSKLHVDRNTGTSFACWYHPSFCKLQNLTECRDVNLLA